MKNIKPILISSLLALVVSVVFAPVASAQDSLTFPFQGYLERDGVPQGGNFDIKLTLWDDSSGGNQVYTVTRNGVIVRDGYFSVFIGPLTQAQVDTGQLYLSIEVRETGDANFVALQGRQRIAAAVYAARGAPATDFTVDGNLQVGVNLQVNGALSWQCPAGTDRIGDECITDLQITANFTNATQTCHDLGMRVCSLATLLRCDRLNIPTNGSTKCGDATDAPGGVVIWTGDVYTSGTSIDNYNQSIAVWFSDAHTGSDQVLRVNGAGFHNYYCCAPVNTVLSVQ